MVSMMAAMMVDKSVVWMAETMVAMMVDWMGK